MIDRRHSLAAVILLSLLLAQELIGSGGSNFIKTFRQANVRVAGNGALIEGDTNGLTITRTGVGLYSITSTEWNSFAIYVTPRTSDNNNTRDQRKAAYFSIANGWQLRITEDDNGAGADNLQDEEFMLYAREFVN